MKPSNSIKAVAAVQFLGSLAILLVPVLLLTDEIRLHRWSPRTYQPKPAVFYDLYVALPICLSLFGVATSIGLVRLREWARRVTLYFPAVSLLLCALWLILHHPRPLGDALFVAGDFTNAFAAILLVNLAPISLWWWILLTRESVRSQFRQISSPSSPAQITE
jgi:hypothetical protein